MLIERINPSQRWSDAVIHNHTVYFVDVPTTLTADLTEQTRQVLTSVEQTLKELGSDKSKLLVVTIYLKDIQQIDLFNQVWDAWLPQGCAPVRACVQAVLADPGYQVELQIIAAL